MVFENALPQNFSVVHQCALKKITAFALSIQHNCNPDWQLCTNSFALHWDLKCVLFWDKFILLQNNSFNNINSKRSSAAISSVNGGSKKIQKGSKIQGNYRHTRVPACPLLALRVKFQTKFPYWDSSAVHRWSWHSQGPIDGHGHPRGAIDGHGHPRGAIDGHGNPMAPILGQRWLSDGPSLIMEKLRRKKFVQVEIWHVHLMYT